MGPVNIPIISTSLFFISVSVYYVISQHCRKVLLQFRGHCFALLLHGYNFKARSHEESVISHCIPY
jgi:hypothetical protein